ncbi:Hint domain-containing protein [Streptomyces lushanensis]|uniref:Hint domain-containing protein n=1 Tax=Streptomyces lushanensis TaxID=1434255 RepID=UPI00082DAAEB|nr:Hint domain-containing protein [Streptomyces lushanensis]
MLGLRGAQRGQGTIEYVGLVVVVAAIVGALVTTGVGPTLAEGIGTQVCRITGGSDCGGGGGGETEAVGEQDDPGADDPPGDPASDIGGADGTGGTGGTDETDTGDSGDPGELDAGEKTPTQIDYETALKELQDAQAAERADSDKAKEAAEELAKILADELGITDALDCVTKGDMGACTETLVNVLLSLVGGAVGKLAAKYGAPWKWKKAVELVGKLKKHGDDLYDGIKGLIKNRKRVGEAEDGLADAKRKLDAEKAKDADKPGRKPENEPATCPVRHSFLPGTPVLLADGRRTAIERVPVGALVLATDPVTGVTRPRPVVRTITTHDDKDFTRLTVATASGPAVITATDTHPFWLSDRNRWADAGEITPGDELRTPSGTAMPVVAVAHHTQRRTTQDLTVAGIHTYYVLVGSAPALVHNQDICDPLTREQLDEAYRANNSQKVLDHVFDKADHGFDDLVRKSGGREQALKKIVDSLGDGPMTQKPGGRPGEFELRRVVEGETVTIRGRMVNGIARISTAFIPAKHPGNR